jgi:F420-dependent oxidoreductase-like protein
MRIGIFGGEGPVDQLVSGAEQAAADGFASYWLPQIFGFDAMAICGVIGQKVPDLDLGTAVVPTYPRHPFVMAQQALTANTLAGGRFTLGIGLSHQIVIEGMFGYSFDKPLRHMRDYLAALLPLLNGESVGVNTEAITANGQINASGAITPDVMIAALGPKMLELAGRETAGTITWMTGPVTLTDHIRPSITDAAEAAGRPAPRIAAGLPVCVTDDADRARTEAATMFAIYGQLPSYQAMIEREGADGPAGIAMVGNEDHVAEQIQRVADAGVTDLAAVEFTGDPDDRARTRAFLKTLL